MVSCNRSSLGAAASACRAGCSWGCATSCASSGAPVPSELKAVAASSIRRRGMAGSRVIEGSAAQNASPQYAQRHGGAPPDLGRATMRAMTDSNTPRAAVIGGGPAGLMAAEQLREAGIAVDLYDAMGSVGRKFLLAGKGGLNLTHGEAFEDFVGRYGERAGEVADWLRDFDAEALRAWARSFGVETFVGSSGRVF